MKADEQRYDVLSRRIDNLASLREELSAWETCRNEESKCVDWQFTTADAREKLKRLYPNI
jgi:hypothetical protein